MEPARALLDELKALVASIPRDEEKIIPAEYAARIRAVGDVPFLLALFREFSDSQLMSWMFWLAFYWKDLPYRTWRLFLRRISDDSVLLYQFVRIASEFLGIDTAAMIRDEEEIADEARKYADRYLARGVPRSETAWFVEICEDLGIDYRSIWTRLAAEGAPMNVDLAAAPRG